MVNPHTIRSILSSSMLIRKILRRIWCRILWGGNHPYRRIVGTLLYECPVCGKRAEGSQLTFHA